MAVSGFKVPAPGLAQLPTLGRDSGLGFGVSEIVSEQHGKSSNATGRKSGNRSSRILAAASCGGTVDT